MVEGTRDAASRSPPGSREARSNEEGAEAGSPPALRLHDLFRQAPGAVALLHGPDHVYELVNDAYSALIGHREVIGKSLAEALPEVVGQGFVELMHNVYRTGQSYVGHAVPVLLARQPGGPQEERLLDFVYQPIRNRSGAVTDIFVEATDVTDRLKAEADRAEAEAKAASRRAFLEQVSDALRDAAGPAAAMLAAAEMLGRQLKVERCGYGDVDADGAYFIVGGRWPGGEMPSHADRLQLAEFGPELVAECRSGRAVRIRDTHLDPRAAGWQATYEKLGQIRAAILVPLIRDGAFVAALYAHQSTPREWTEEEEDLIREVAERSWTAVERARAQQSAIDSAERLRLATEAASIGTWDYDPVGGTLEWDARCKALFGLPADAPVTYEGVFLAGLHPDDRAAADLAVRRALDEQSPERFDIEYRTIGIEDGVERWIAATGDAIFEAGKAVRFIGTVIDISARKKAERHLKILNDTGAAVAAELNLERIVQIVTDAGVALSGAQFGAFFYNVLDDHGGSYMLYALSGAPREAFEKFPMPRNTAVFEPTFRGTAVVRSDDILKDPRYGHNAPRKGMPKGHLPVRSYLAVPVISRSGEVLGGLFFGHGEVGKFQLEHETALLGIAGHGATAIDNARLFQSAERELVERRRAEAALQALNTTLEQRVVEEVAERSKAEDQLRQVQKMEAVGQLTGGIAHDFNNMLAVVIGGLNLLQRKLAKGETDVDRFIEGAMDGARRAAALTQRLLAFSRQQPLTPEPVNANRMVAGMSELLARTLGETISVETVLAAGLWQVRADPGQLESAILNLSVNARDAMPQGGRLTIETSNAYIDETYAKESSLATGQFVLIAVTDTGSGMSPEVIAKAFDPFFTTKRVGKGTGLGLSQVYGFVRQSGGNVRIYSELEVGTTVKIYLPRYYGETGSASVDRHRLPVSGGLKSEVVMVVEDEDRVRTISAEALRDLGYTVVEASGPREAIQLIESGHKISLLFTDVVMPDMSGRELVDVLRRANADLKVLYTTGYTRNAIVHNGILDPGTQLLPKPFTVEDLAAKVRSILDE